MLRYRNLIDIGILARLGRGLVLGAAVVSFVTLFAGAASADIGSVWMVSRTSNSITIDWTAPAGKYRLCPGANPKWRICWKKSSQILAIACNQNSVTTNSKPYTITGLSPGVKYKIKVYAKAEKKKLIGNGWKNCKWREVGNISQQTLASSSGGSGSTSCDSSAVVGSVSLGNLPFPMQGLRVTVNVTNPATIDVVRIVYKRKNFWNLAWLTTGKKRTGPSGSWGSSNQDRGWVDLPSNSTIYWNKPSLQSCKVYEVAAFGFCNGEKWGDKIGSSSSMKVNRSYGACGLFGGSWHKRALDDHEDTMIAYALALEAYYAPLSVHEALTNRFPCLDDELADLNTDLDSGDSFDSLAVIDYLMQTHPERYYRWDYERSPVGLDLASWMNSVAPGLVDQLQSETDPSMKNPVKINDFDGDGISEIAVGMIDADSDLQPNSGKVSVFSSMTTKLLFEISGDAPGEGFGASIAMIGDRDGDGISEFAVGAPGAANGAGEVRIYSGTTAVLLNTIQGVAGDQASGCVLAGLSDIDGDGISEIAVGSTSGIRIWSLQNSVGNSSALITFGGPCDADSSIKVGDMDGDGISEIAVGYPKASVGGLPFSGLVEVHSFSGGTTQLLHSSSGASADEEYGASLDIADVNGDGVLNLIVGVPGSDNGTGEVRVMDIAGGSANTTTINGKASGERFGDSLAAIGDMDGDGISEICVGAPGVLSEIGNEGRISIFSVVSSYSIEVIGEFPGQNLGSAVTRLEDLDGDGSSEFLITSVRAPRPEVLGGIHIVKADGRYIEGVDSAVSEIYPGHIGDLQLVTKVNDLQLTSSPCGSVQVAHVNDQLDIQLASPAGSLIGVPFNLMVTVTTSGLPLPQQAPGVYFDPLKSFTLIPGLPNFGPQGLALSFEIPAGLSGRWLQLQGFALSSNSALGYLTTNGSIIDLR